MTRWSVLQRASGERKSSGSAARTGESGQREREEGTGGEAKGTGGKEKTGRKPEWMSVRPPGWVAAAAPSLKQIFKMDFCPAGGRAATGRGAERCKGKRSCCQAERSCC